jgi:hypothetical protein
LGNAFGNRVSGSGNKQSSELCRTDYLCSLKFRKGKVFLVAGDQVVRLGCLRILESRTVRYWLRSRCAAKRLTPTLKNKEGGKKRPPSSPFPRKRRSIIRLLYASLRSPVCVAKPSAIPKRAEKATTTVMKVT